MERRTQPLSRSSTALPVRPLRGGLLAMLVLLAGAALTGFAWYATVAGERRRARAELALQTAEIQSAIQDRLLAYEGLLRAGVGLSNALWPLSSKQWQQFTAQLRLAAVYPGILGVGFAARIATRADLEYWSGTLRGLDPEDLTAQLMQGGRLPQSAVVFLEPPETRNRHALGYDMMSEPRRRAAMERARDTGRAALSAKVVLVQDSRLGTSAAGFLLYLPVYSTPAVPAGVAQRQAALRGFVYSPFRAGDFFASVLLSGPAGVSVEVFDGASVRADALLYRSATWRPHPELTQLRRLLIAGHEWTLRVSALRTHAALQADRAATTVVLAGVVSTLLLAGLVQALALSRQRLHERVLADIALAQREQQAAQVLENSLDAYIVIDANDIIVEWNRQAEALFGWSAHEATGRKLFDTIVPPDLAARHAAAVASFATRSEHPLLGRRLEMPARCRNGSELTTELSIVQISAPGGPRFVASLRDITQERRQAAEIRLLTQTLEQRVAERTAQLEQANHELSAANRDLEAFAYSVSHDLRAPLRAIDGHILRLTEDCGATSDTQRHHASAIRRNVARMNKLIEDLLNFALIGRRPLAKQTVMLWEIVRAVLHELPAAPAVVYEVSPEELGEVHADPALIKQALTNLIANAIKFSRQADPPRVRIGSETTAGETVYFVIDNGVGFDMQYADKLFGVFERLHSAAEFEGSGVGLAIVKQIIERHGGRVWARSQPGRGAAFYFTLR